MKKKDYRKPTMKVVKLQQQSHILAGSQGVEANRSSYGTAIEETWGDSSNSRRGNDAWDDEEEQD